MAHGKDKENQHFLFCIQAQLFACWVFGKLDFSAKLPNIKWFSWAFSMNFSSSLLLAKVKHRIVCAFELSSNAWVYATKTPMRKKQKEIVSKCVYMLTGLIFGTEFITVIKSAAVKVVTKSVSLFLQLMFSLDSRHSSEMNDSQQHKFTISANLLYLHCTLSALNAFANTYTERNRERMMRERVNFRQCFIFSSSFFGKSYFYCCRSFSHD